MFDFWLDSVQKCRIFFLFGNPTKSKTSKREPTFRLVSRPLLKAQYFKKYTQTKRLDKDSCYLQLFFFNFNSMKIVKAIQAVILIINCSYKFD